MHWFSMQLPAPNLKTAGHPESVLFQTISIEHRFVFRSWPLPNASPGTPGHPRLRLLKRVLNDNRCFLDPGCSGTPAQDGPDTQIFDVKNSSIFTLKSIKVSRWVGTRPLRTRPACSRTCVGSLCSRANSCNARPGPLGPAGW